MQSEGTVAPWRKDGLPVDEEFLADLGLTDTEALFDYAGAAFHFSLETVAGRGVLVALRELGVPDPGCAPVCIAAFADAGPVAAHDQDSEFRAPNQFGGTARWVAVRRSISVQIFRQAHESVDARRPAGDKRLISAIAI